MTNERENVMTLEEIMTVLREYAENTGLVLGDLDDQELRDLLDVAQAVVDAVHQEIRERS